MSTEWILLKNTFLDLIHIYYPNHLIHNSQLLLKQLIPTNSPKIYEVYKQNNNKLHNQKLHKHKAHQMEVDETKEIIEITPHSPPDNTNNLLITTSNNQQPRPHISKQTVHQKDPNISNISRQIAAKKDRY